MPEIRDEWGPLASTIEDMHRRLDHRLGWRFLTCPAQNVGEARVGLISINPGGQGFEPPVLTVEQGSAYEVEAWKQYPPGAEPLQLQVQLLLRLAGVAPGDELSAYFVPFRSRDWASLKQKAASVAFGERLWTGILAHASVRTIFGVGKGVLGTKLSEMHGAQLYRTDPSGWGELTIDTYRASDGRALILLPHLSRFRLFGRPGGIAEATVAAILKTVQVR